MSEVRERLRGEAGANAVEFALVLPVLLLIVFGVLWGGLALNSQIALSQTAREAARYGATLPYPANGAWFDQVEGRLADSVDLQLTSGEASYCIRAYGPNGASLGSRPSGCSSTSLASGAVVNMARVEVEIESPAFSIGSLFPSTTLSSDAIARHEGPE